MSKTVSKKTEGEASSRKPPASQKPARLPGTSHLEWSIAGISAAALGAVVIYLLFIALTSGNGPAQIQVSISDIVEHENAHVAEFVARNESATSAAGIEIVGRLTEGAKVIEESSVTLDYIPQNSERRGGLMFSNDPRRYDLQVSAAGYFEP